jgi:hypothetical protein
MSPKDDEGVQPEQISVSAVYHQLDDHLAPDEAPYAVDSGLQRLLGWMGGEAPPDEGRPQIEAASEPAQLEPTMTSSDELELTRMRLMAVDRLAQSRKSNSRVAFGAVVLVSVLAGMGLLFRLSYVPAHVALPALVAVGAIDGVLTLAVVALYRTTMKGLHDDLRLAFGGQTVRRERLDNGRQVSSRPVSQRPRRGPLVVRSRVDTYPPLLQFLVTVAFLGFAAASVLAYATHSLLPFTVTSIVVAGLFVISVLPVVITAIWTASEFRRRAADSALYLMLARRRVPHEEAISRPVEMTVSTQAAERDGDIYEPDT